MEKGNAEETSSQPEETASGSTARGSISAEPGKGDAPELAPLPEADPGPAPAAGGGSQADQSGPAEEATQERRREVLYQGYTEVPHPDGSVLRLDGNGGATFSDGSHVLRLEGDRWVDAKSGQETHRGQIAKADHRLRSLEMDRGLRKSMTE